jgi:diguanylate cyclase (GGDEF)-like protein
MPEPPDERTISLLGRLPLFSALGPGPLAVVARHCAFRSFSSGDRVFDQDTQANELFVVESGAVSVRKRTDDQGDTELARFVAGETIGEIDLVDTVPRSAFADATEPTTLLVFPAAGANFPALVERHPEVFAPVLETLLAGVARRIRSANRLVSEKAPWVRELQRQVYRDRLTGLHNRTWLEEELDGLLQNRPRTALLVMKPDRFKAIVDTWGHAAGDAGIVLLAEAGRKAVGSDGTLVRYRGDEFAAVLPGAGIEDACRCAERLHAAVPLTASIGIAAWPGGPERGAELTARAFGLMWEARRAGGNGTRWT